MKQTKISRHFNKRSNKYEFTSWVSDIGLLKSISVLINNYNPKKMLDLGIGTGLIEQELTDSIEVFGIDISEKMLKICREKIPKIRLIHGDISNVVKYYNNENFDLIFSRAVLGHFKIDPVLAQAKSLLAPNGKIFLCESIAYNNQDCKNQIDFHNLIHKGHIEFPTSEQFVKKFKNMDMKILNKKVVYTYNSVNRLCESIKAAKQKRSQIIKFLFTMIKSQPKWHVNLVDDDIVYRQAWLLIVAQ